MSLESNLPQVTTTPNQHPSEAPTLTHTNELDSKFWFPTSLQLDYQTPPGLCGTRPLGTQTVSGTDFHCLEPVLHNDTQGLQCFGKLYSPKGTGFSYQVLGR